MGCVCKSSAMSFGRDGQEVTRSQCVWLEQIVRMVVNDGRLFDGLVEVFLSPIG